MYIWKDSRIHIQLSISLSLPLAVYIYISIYIYIYKRVVNIRTSVINKIIPRAKNVHRPVKLYYMYRKRIVKSLTLENFATVISKPAVNNKLTIINQW